MTSALERITRLGAVVITVSCAVALSACGGAANDQQMGNGGSSAATPRESAEVCRLEVPPTAGNRVSWFLGDVVQGRDPTIQGGVDDPFGCAYMQLCAEIRVRISEDEFRASRAEAVSSVLSANTWAGARTGYRYTTGVDEQRPDLETLDSDVTATWKDVDFTWYEHFDDRTIASGSGVSVRWRLELVREDGSWRVCGFEKRN
jgi:hypothetical protein